MGKPKIRFEGYSEDWEQRKLGEVCEIKDSARIPNSEWSESGIPYIRASDVTNENTDGVLFISQERYEFYKNRTGAPTKNDVLFNGGGEIGKSLLITDEKPIYVQGGAVLYARTSKSRELVGQYLKTYFETTNAKSYIDAASAGGTMRHFTLKPSQKMRILMPSVEEQEKIGGYFVNLDRLITLHQRKYDETKTLKKYMLQKMFPQNGEKVPEIRFDGFTEDWEQRKLGDITTKIGSGKTPKGGAAAYKDDGIALIRSQNVNGDRVDLSDVVFIDEQTDEDMKNSRVLKGDVLLNITGASIGRSAVFTRELRANVNQHVCIIRTKGSDASPEFIQLNIISSNGQNQIDSFQAGGGREGLNFHQIGKMEFLYPGIEEQQKIGQYFANLDHLITLHQRKYDETKKLRSVKKFMLQNMFI